MAFPWIFDENFELGTKGGFDTAAGTVTFPHYSTLAGIPSIGPAAPFRGAFCMQSIVSTTDNTLLEADLDIADTVTRWSSFYCYVSPNFTGTANDTLPLYELQSAGNVVENVVGLRITATGNLLDIGIGKATPTSFPASFSRGVWHHIELQSDIQTAGTGIVTLWLDGANVGNVGTLTNVAVIQGVLGTQDVLSTTSGTVLFDRFIFDDAHVFPEKVRFPTSVTITRDTHVFVGPGWIDSATLLSASGTLVLYDTDTANTDNAEAVVDIDSTRGRIAYDGGAEFRRGCYADIATNARGEVKLFTGRDWRTGKYGPIAYGSNGAIRSYGARRRPRPGNV